MLAKQITKIAFGIVAFWVYSFSFAATMPDSFKIEVNPTKVNLGEAVDVTISAVDKNGAVIKDYAGEVLIFSQTDPKAEFPGTLSENTYKFKASDAGKVKFENAVKFSKAGNQDVNVYDISNEDIFGFAEVVVGEGGTKASSGTTTSEVKITSPESGVTLPTKSVKVSGMAQKNYKVDIYVNNKKETQVISNSDGLFQAELKNVQDGQNTVKAKVIDANDKVIWESTDTIFTIESQGAKIQSVKLTPEGEIDTESKISIEVQTQKDLPSVSVMLNDVVENLTQKTPGVYVGSLTAPKEAGDYKLDVIVKNDIWVESKEAGIKTITVKKVELTAAPVVEATATGNAAPEPVKVDCDNFKSQLEIKNTKLVKLKTKSILTWDKVEKASSYNIYKKDPKTQEIILVTNSTENKFEVNITGDKVTYEDFVVKAVFKDDVCNIEGNPTTITKVQTGPTEVALVLITFLLSTGYFIYRRKQA